ncbi:MAG TPA: nickel pincer cofactor biosynthesis protein LarC, partial [Oscillospiraceae bacterium]|nr:nickel pincer cofactor biosynthesis protein LarC [Oscillospiraceae bacterium]
MKLLYFDCFAGASGDMILGALLAAGATLDFVNSELAKLPFTGYQLKTTQVIKKGIAATRLLVEITEAQQPHRSYHTIREMLNQSDLAKPVRDLSLAIFARLAAAEGKIHGRSPEEVHFHEVGAVDSIIDIVGAAAALTELAADKVYASALHTGRGFVNCAHGRLPVPAPATLEVLAGAPIYATELEGELLTPTGAAILATIAEFTPLPLMTVQQIGYGAGQKELPIANVLRVMVGESADSDTAQHEQVTVLEATIDDQNPELYGYIMAKLFAMGAVDVTMTPLYMKKNRPGILLTVLVAAAQEQAVITTIFQETTTLGLRRSTAEKLRLTRRQLTVQTPYGSVRMKIAEQAGQICNAAPEYADCT